jgi:large subunit ribosomal protein L13
MYHRFTGYIGNLKTESWPGAGAPPGARDRDRREGHAAEEPAGRAMYRKLKVYAGPNHPHAAQQPQVLDI